MTVKNNGGPAFPVPAETWNLTGMSLRDYFAAKAMQGILSNLDLKKEIVVDGKTVSIPQLSYMYADSMMQAREEK